MILVLYLGQGTDRATIGIKVYLFLAKNVSE